jgi:glycosyltransferase involved in cell wall biosynthesis
MDDTFGLTVGPCWPLRDEFPRDGRPRLVQMMLWPMGIGGAPRMVWEWCWRNKDLWDIHVVTTGTTGPWDWSGIAVHADLDPGDVDEVLEKISPDLLVNHFPHAPVARRISPQVWIMHGLPFLRQPPPATPTPPTEVFTNLDCIEIHPKWRRLNWHILPIGVDLDEYAPVPRKPTGELVVGIIGRLHPEKFPRDPNGKLSTSLSAALHQWDRGPWRVKIIGQAKALEWQDRFRSEVADLPWVEFVADVPPEQMPAVYHELDAVLVPTPPETGETGCYSAVEALASGVPVVARDLPGLRQSCLYAAQYGKTDADLLAAIRTLDDPAIRAHYAREGRRVAEAIHDLNKHLATHSKAFADALVAEVSILLPVFNTPGAYLKECWESIKAQTFTRWECVLVDDGSTDPETVAAIDAIAADPRVRLLRLPSNQGAYAARNLGLEECRSDLIAVMDSDDVMTPERLAIQVTWMKAHPDVDVLGAQIEIFDGATGRVLHTTSHPEEITGEVIAEQRANGSVWFINHPTAVYRKAKVLAVGGYPERTVCHDLGLWLKLFKAGAAIRNLPYTLVRYRWHPGQLTQAVAERQRQHDEMIAEVFGGAV